MIVRVFPRYFIMYVLQPPAAFTLSYLRDPSTCRYIFSFVSCNIHFYIIKYNFYLINKSFISVGVTYFIIGQTVWYKTTCFCDIIEIFIIGNILSCHCNLMLRVFCLLLAFFLSWKLEFKIFASGIPCHWLNWKT